MLVALSHGATSAHWGVTSPHTVAAPLAYAGHGHFVAPNHAVATPVTYAGLANIASSPVVSTGT